MTTFSVRIFLGYFLILSLAAGLMVHTHVSTVQPAMRQTVEDALADTAHLLAAVLSAQSRHEMPPASSNVKKHSNSVSPTGRVATLDATAIQRWLDAYQQHPQQAVIWGIHKSAAGYRLYVTDQQGRVIADTQRQHVGADYSRWNDVYLSLRGHYGARSTRESANDDDASTLYVAAPIRDAHNAIIGVVSVSRNVQALQPYVDSIRADIYRDAALMLGAALLLAALFSAWIATSVRRVAVYAHAVSEGQRDVLPPASGPREIRMLGAAVDAMRKHLEGKAYVEQYVHALTHALKSPLAGMQAHLELLEGPLDDADRQRLLGFAQHEAQRMQDSIERLLQLARLEQQQRLQHRQRIDALAITRTVIEGAQPQLNARAITCEVIGEHAHDCPVEGEVALLQLALDSLMANALAFTPRNGTVRISFATPPQQLQIRIFNSGEPIPDYALARVFERFFSLPRPETGQRSSGLGLSLAREIALLHGGDLTLENTPGGVIATLSLAAV